MPPRTDLIPTAPRSLCGRFIGVIPLLSFEDLAYPKRLLLMFDSLALDLGAGMLSEIERRIFKAVAHEIDWLRSEELLTTLGGLAASAGSPLARRVSVTGGDLLGPVLGRRVDTIARVGQLVVVAAFGLRQTAATLRTEHGVDAVAVPTEPLSNLDETASRDTVIRIVLEEFPLPCDATPWQNVLEFRQEGRALGHFARLKAWLNKAGASGLRNYEVSDNLRELLHEYEEGMRLSRMKAQKGVLEVLITTTAEVAESLVKARWAKAAEAFFSVRRHQLDLLEAEKGMPGREVAYIVAARRTFQPRPLRAALRSA